jgi:hypothetical protein
MANVTINIDSFLGNAHAKWERRADIALRKIVKLRWWERWKAKRIAQEVLGIGPYWNKEFK